MTGPILVSHARADFKLKLPASIEAIYFHKGTSGSAAAERMARDMQRTFLDHFRAGLGNGVAAPPVVAFDAGLLVLACHLSDIPPALLT